MVVVYGTKLCGRVDHVPGVFYVATKFAHCWYLPLVPLGSYAVFEESSDEFSGIPINRPWAKLARARLHRRR